MKGTNIYEGSSCYKSTYVVYFLNFCWKDYIHNVKICSEECSVKYNFFGKAETVYSRNETIGLCKM